MRLRHALLGLLVACQTPPPPERTETAPKPTEAARAPVSIPLPQVASSQALEQVAPFTLTASDGSGLVATRIAAKAVVQGPLAFTELHLYFANTEDRVREGTFAITLPANAAISRFAMENDGQLVEAEVVEKQLARRAYEDFLHRKQDPALMEKAEGNQFTARVFPIPARSTKHLVVSFSHELPGARYVLPLRGLPTVQQIDVALDVTGSDGAPVSQVLSERNWRPDRDFVSTAPTAAEAIAAGQFLVAQVAPFDQATVPSDVPTTIAMLVDTSASRALGFARYAATVRELIATLATKYPGVTVDVIAFDQDTQAIYRGAASGFGAAELAALTQRGAAGASDLAQALTKVDGADRVVVVGDGVVTAGSSGAELTAQVKQLASKKVQRVDVLLAGGIRDAAVARTLVTAGLARTGAVVDLDASVSDAAAAIGERVLANVPVQVAGATWVYPQVIESARPGQRVMVYAKLQQPRQSVAITVGDARRTVAPIAGTQALVERAAAAAEIADLEAQLATVIAPATATQLKGMIAQKSVAARVISSQTSLLVLESDGDYARYGIDRNALADILVVGPRGLEQTRRITQLASVPDANKRQQTIAATEATEAKDKAKDDSPAASASASATDTDDSLTAPRGGADEQKLERAEAKPVDPAADRIGGDEERAAAPAAEPVAAAPAHRAPPSPPPPPPPPRRPAPTTIATTGALEAQQLRTESDGGEAWRPAGGPAALRGELAEISKLIASKNARRALAVAQAWHDKNPGDVLALIGMGEALEAQKDLARAARMYGSIIDLFPARADLRRFAGERLERIGAQARTLAIDTYQRAVDERPDHLTGHRLLAYAQLRAGQHAAAFATILASLEREYPAGRFLGGERILREDAGLIGAAYTAAVPSKAAEIKATLDRRGIVIPKRPSTRFIMYWETDANDVDFHIQDARGGHAWYSNQRLPSGGELYADVTTGYGPECFTIEGTPTAGPYRVSINYYSQGPMGYGMGLLQVLRHDGKGGLAFEDKPYVIMNDHAYVDLGSFK